MLAKILRLLLIVLVCHTFARAQAAAPPRPAITGIADVALYASDPAASKLFYADLLGLAQNPGQANVYRVGTRQQIEIESLPAGEGINRLSHIAFATADADAMRRYLAAHGVAVPAQTVLAANGTRGFAMKDPEGHSIEFVEVKSSPPPATVHMEHSVSKHLIHAGFVVRDRALEDRFYKDLLGFHLYWYGGMKDTEADWIDMQVPDGTDWLEYMMVTGKGTLSPRTMGILNHVALGVPKISDVVAILARHGWHPSDDEQAQMGRDGKWQLNLYDPDGTRVEVMEFRPSQKLCCAEYSGEHPQ